MPHALSFLAERDEANGSIRRGVVAWDFTRTESSVELSSRQTQWKPIGPLVHGNELMYRADTKYPVHDKRRVYQHSVNRVMAALKQYRVSGPWLSDLPDAASIFRPASDLMTGYLMLDAWIGNTDRHHENWGVIEIRNPDPNPPARIPAVVFELAPTYDHASSLGAHLTETEFQERISTKDRNRTVEAYVERGRSAFYTEGQQTGKVCR